MEALRIPGGTELAHAYIAASMNEEARLGLARTLAAAMLCEADGVERPCGRCRACRKSLAGNHPDIVLVSAGLDSQGRKRREMTVDQVRGLVSDAQVMPNEGRRKVFILADAGIMNRQAQNALLKLLEEPPANTAFILCAENPALLLPTVRSRCELLRANADAEENAEDAAAAEELLGRIASGSRAELLLWCSAHEGMDSRRCAAVLRAAREKLADILLGKSEISLTGSQAARTDALLERCGSYLAQNVGVKSVMALLAVDGIQK